MPKIKFETKVFRRQSIDMIERALVIIDDFKELGFILTLRHLYYPVHLARPIPRRQEIQVDRLEMGARCKWY